MSGGWFYPPGAANDPAAPFNAVPCPECDDEFRPDEIDDHLADEHGIEPDWEGIAADRAEARAMERYDEYAY